MSKLDCANGIININGYDISLGGLAELLDMISGLVDTEIVDVIVDGGDVTCTFADGEKQTAHCHPEDEKRWSLETGISVCLGKYLMGGSSAYNRIVRHGQKIFKDKIKAEAKRIDDLLEKERVRDNKRRKHERYLKRRAERQAEECSKCDERESCEDRKDTNREKHRILNTFDLINDILDNLGIEIELVVR